MPNQPANEAWREFEKVFPVHSKNIIYNGETRRVYALPNLWSLMVNLSRAKELISQQGLPLDPHAYCCNLRSFQLSITYK